MFSNAEISTTHVEQLALSKGHDFVYAMATDQLVKVPVAECETYDNCSSCISSNNPYCGWCVLKNRCSTQVSHVPHSTGIPPPYPLLSISFFIITTLYILDIC